MKQHVSPTAMVENVDILGSQRGCLVQAHDCRRRVVLGQLDHSQPQKCIGALGIKLGFAG